MRELLGQSLSPEADEAALEELAALEAEEEGTDTAALPQVPKVGPILPTAVWQLQALQQR